MMFVGRNDEIGQDSTKAALFDAWSKGIPVTLYDGRTGYWITGLIYSVRVESGYGECCPPCRFLVSLARDDRTVVEDIYLNTVG